MRLVSTQSYTVSGHVISENGIGTDPSNIEAMTNWPTPSNVTEIRFWDYEVITGNA